MTKVSRWNDLVGTEMRVLDYANELIIDHFAKILHVRPHDHGASRQDVAGMHGVNRLAMVVRAHGHRPDQGDVVDNFA